MNKKKSRYGKPKKNRLTIILSVVAGLLLILLLCMVGMMKGSNGETHYSNTEPASENADHSNPPDETQATQIPQPTETVQTDVTKPESAIPCTLEDGKLEISSLFQYTGTNPDCYWENGDNIGAIVLTNQSNEHLLSASVVLKLYDGTVLEFEISEVPAGKTVWAFEKNNKSCDVSGICEMIEYNAQFEPETSLMTEKLSVKVEGMEISLTNTGTELLSNIAVTCHSVFDDAYFGGTSYTYSAEEIPEGETIHLLAEDCFLDAAEVVRITAD